MTNQLQTKIRRSNIFDQLFSWESPDRIWAPKTRSWYVSYSLLFVVIIAVLALLGEYILILAVIAFIFLWFLQAALPPTTMQHVITTLGIRTNNKMYVWDNIKFFWFSKKDQTKMLNVDYTTEESPELVKRLSLILHDDDDQVLFRILLSFISYGSRDAVTYNPLMHLILGEYIDMTDYLPKEEEGEIITQELGYEVPKALELTDETSDDKITTKE